VSPRTVLLEPLPDLSAFSEWFSARRLDGATHFPALEIPDGTAAEIDRFLQ
jgi:hypothetical protein